MQAKRDKIRRTFPWPKSRCALPDAVDAFGRCLSEEGWEEEERGKRIMRQFQVGGTIAKSEQLITSVEARFGTLRRGGEAQSRFRQCALQHADGIELGQAA